jgi:UDP-N-acetylmuramate dehydrogenase
VLVLSVELELPSAVPEEEHQQIAEEKKRRASVTPKGRSAGSTFRNPSGLIAGKLLESSGCKKIQCGTVRVSPDHANWIISEQAESPASEQDYLSVLLQMKQAVFRDHNIELQTELCFADSESERLVREKWKKN